MATIVLLMALLVGDTAREWNERGLAHEDRQEWPQAESAFRKGLLEAQTAEEKLTVASNLAFLALRQGRSGDAKRLAPVLHAALTTATGSGLARGLGCLGSIYWRTGKAVDGIPWLRRSIEAWQTAGLPAEALAVKNNLAAALYDAGRTTEADDVLRELSGTEGPEHPSVLANIATIHAGSRRFAEAATAFEAALDCPYRTGLDAWQQAEIRARYAAVLRKLGRKDYARRQQNEADSLRREANAFMSQRVDWRDLQRFRPAGSR